MSTNSQIESCPNWFSLYNLGALCVSAPSAFLLAKLNLLNKGPTQHTSTFVECIQTGTGNADDKVAAHAWIKLAPQSNKANRFVLLVLAVGAAYFVIGYVFGELDDLGVTERGVFLWRLGAWVASGVVFAVHLWLESKRFGTQSCVLPCTHR